MKNVPAWSSRLQENEMGPAIYHDFLEKALENGTFLCRPMPQVVGKGLGAVQKALDILAKDVSASKILVSL